MPGLCAKLNLTPDEVRFDLYGPQAMQYTHAIIYAGGAYTVPPPPSVNRQAVMIRNSLEGEDELLAL